MAIIAWVLLAPGGMTQDRPWSFEPVRDVRPPDLGDAWIRNPIDAFILKRLRSAGLKPSPPADRLTIVRRLHLVMLGLPPGESTPGAWERLVDRSLASPHFGERWAQHWLDLVRYADTNGFETNTPRPNAWPYRDYVIGALNDDTPYDRFVLDQIAGTGGSTGFLVAGPWDSVKSPDVVLTSMQRQNELHDMVSAAGATFLGLTTGCARCHDHKFDPITQKDYYAMQAIFAGVRHGERQIPVEGLTGIEKQVAEIESRLAQFEPLARPGQTILIDDEDGRRITLLAKKAGHGTNPKGTARGWLDDPGGPARMPNVSGGRYTWWQDLPDRFVFAYRPGVEGRRRIWLSWGCGWNTHATDVRYVLDRDGDPSTRDDQKILATIDQQRFADGTLKIQQKPLWSGFKDAGIHDLAATSAILVRSGTSGRPVTADVIALERAAGTSGLPSLRSPVNAKKNVDRFEPVKAKLLRFTIEATNNGSEPCIDELEIRTADGRNVAPGAKLASSGNYAGNSKHKLIHLSDGRIGNGRSWISNERGKGWVTIELPEATVIDRVVWGRDRDLKYKDRVPTRYSIDVAVKPDAWRTVAGSGDRLPFGTRVPGSILPGATDPGARDLIHELRALTLERDALRKRGKVYAGKFQKPGPTHLLRRGDPMQKLEAVAPAVPAAFQPVPLDAGSAERDRRRELARWIGRADHPLTARVIVNRVWQHHFGTGLVDTPSDFGANGSRPTHPELLDWLAAELIRGGWPLKRLHRLILTSNTWRQSSIPRPDGLAADARTRLLWRFPPRRLEAEAIRDSVLAVSGALDLKMGGPGWDAFKPNTNYVRNYVPKDRTGPAEWRRMVYVYKVRMEESPVFGAFDSPDAGQLCAKRSRSTTAIQALNLFNSDFIVRQAERFARRLSGNPRDQALRAFTLALGRPPDAAELAAAIKLIRAHGAAPFCRALFNASEFLFIQ